MLGGGDERPHNKIEYAISIIRHTALTTASIHDFKNDTDTDNTGRSRQLDLRESEIRRQQRTGRVPRRTRPVRSAYRSRRFPLPDTHLRNGRAQSSHHHQLARVLRRMARRSPERIRLRHPVLLRRLLHRLSRARNMGRGTYVPLRPLCAVCAQDVCLRHAFYYKMPHR